MSRPLSPPPRRLFFVAGVFVAALAAVAAQATTLVHLELEELTAAAALVARAKCLESSSQWEGGNVWTFTTFQVLEMWKGNAPERIIVRLVGGRANGRRVLVEGVPSFLPGEEVVLFLEPSASGGLTVTSWAQGTFRVRRDAATGRASVTQDTSGLSVFDPAKREFRPGGIRQLPLDELRQRVLVAAQRVPGRRP